MINLKQSPFLGAVLLVAGTAIGAGMLGLPVSTAVGGFVPAAVIFIVTWVVMLFSALMLLEVNLALPAGNNLISMAEATLGVWGKVLAWGSYLMLLYALDAAYLSGMSAMLHSVVMKTLSEAPAQWLIVVVFTLIFAGIVFWGTRVIDQVNRLFIGVLVVAYGLLVWQVAPHVQAAQLGSANWHAASLALPLIVTSFGFHIVIPSLRNYLGESQGTLRKAVLVGSCLPIVVYLCWEALILGVVPMDEAHGLLAMQVSAQPTVDLANGLRAQLHSAWIGLAFNGFTFCAITTSLIGVSLSLFDFIVDGLHLPAGNKGRVLAAMATFVPPMGFALFYPKGFLLALGYGGIFVAVLLIFLPAAMVLFGRRKAVIPVDSYRAPGGSFAPCVLIAFAMLVIIVELVFAH